MFSLNPGSKGDEKSTTESKENKRETNEIAHETKQQSASSNTTTSLSLTKKSSRTLREIIDRHSIGKSYSYAGKPYSLAYATFFQDYGFNIQQQSLINTSKVLRIKLNDSEKLLKTTWREKLVPLLTLKHGTTINFDVLKPLAERTQQDELVSNAHTFDQKSLRSFSYFVLGIGDNHPVPNFLGGSIDTILVKLKKTNNREQREHSNLLNETKAVQQSQPLTKALEGLWIGGHLSPYYQSQHLPPVLFGTTRRQITFDAQTLTKTYHYYYENGEKFERTVHFSEEIFAADKNLDALFDAMFYQFIMELHYIKGSFQDYFEKNPTDTAAFITAFHSLFQSWIYPEAKLPLALDLNTSYVEKRFLPKEIKELQKSWFEAAESADVVRLEKILQQAQKLSISLINTLNGRLHATALMLVIKSKRLQTNKDKQLAAIQFLLKNGADITITEQEGKDAIQHAVVAGKIDILKILLEGNIIANSPIIKQLIDTSNDYFVKLLSLAISYGQLKTAYFILEKITTIPIKTPIIIETYCSHFSKEVSADEKQALINQLLAKGANINAVDAQGISALMHAAKQGDLPFTQYFLKQKPNINQIIVTETSKIPKDEVQIDIQY